MNVYQKMTLYLQPKSNSYCHRNRANGRTANRGNCGKICRRGNTTGNETRSDK